MKKFTIYIIACLSLAVLLKTGCSDINNVTPPEQSDGIKSVVPARAPYGARVVIGGQGFEEVEQVLFNGTEAIIEAASDTVIVTRVPMDAVSGPLEVISSQETFIGPSFTVDSTKNLFLTIKTVSPTQLRVGDTLRITGTGFNSITVEADEPVANVQSDTRNDIKLTPDARPLSDLDHKLLPEKNLEPDKKKFKTISAQPEVFINDVATSLVEVMDTLIIATVPENAQSGLLSVIVEADTAIGPEMTILRHSIAEISPTAGEVGTEVTISGADFSEESSENIVAFSGTKAPVISANTNELIVEVPEGAASGAVTVTINNITITGPDFTVQVSPPAITSLTPETGAPGTEVTISGSNFSAIASENMVFFNGIEAEVISASESQIITQVPEGASDGPVEVQVGDQRTTGPDFDVITLGELLVIVATTGAELDENGYLISVDGSEGERVAINDTLSQTGLTEGSHEVGISDIQSNCFTTGDFPNPRTVNINADEVTRIEYNISCEGSNEPPVAQFTSTCTNLACNFDASGSADSDGLIESYEWIFDDGTTGSGEEITHSYEAPGSYTVELTITDNEGAIAIETEEIKVTVPQITELSPSSGAVGTEVMIIGSGFSSTLSENSVTFTSGSAKIDAPVKSAGETELIVDVPNDATSGPVQVTVNGYTTEGPSFIVEVLGNLEIITSTTGSSLDPDGYLITVEEVGEESVQVNDTLVYKGLDVGSYQLGISGIASNCQLSEESPNRTVDVNQNSTTSTSFNVSCSDPNEPPVAVIESFCVGLDCGFTGTSSSDTDGNVVSYEWDFGDGFTASGDTVTHTYETEGAYGVELIVTDNEGATDTAVQNINVMLPQITSIDPETGPIGTEVTITGTGFSDIEGANAVGFTSGETIIGAELISESTTELVATVPADATTGPVYVAVGEDYVTEGPVFTVEQTSEPKTLQVEVNSEGLTGDGYTLLVTGQDARFVEPNSSTMYYNIFENEVFVELSGLGDNCTLEGENPRLVNLDNSDNAGYTAFNVSCSGPAPTIESIDPESGGYGSSVIIVGSNFSAVLSENNVQFNGMRAELNSASETEIDAIVPWNATSGPVTVTVNGQTATGPDFTVIEPKTLEIITNTTGSDLDPDGYTLSITSLTDTDIAVNDTLVYNELYQNEVTVELSGIAQNCTIDGINPRTVDLDNSDNSGSTVFNVSCSALSPEIDSIDPTSGPTGSEVVITGTNFSSVASENNVQFNGVRAELNSASETELLAVVPGSATTGPVTVTIDDYTASGPTFTVLQAKTLEVAVETEGTAIDPNGYTVSVTGESDRNLMTNDNTMYYEIYDNNVEVALTGVANNCRIEGENPRTVNLDNSDNAGFTSFTVDCTVDLRGEIIFTTDRDDGSEIYQQNEQATSVKPITSTPSINENTPAISPDGLKIVYSSDNHIFVMDSDGSDVIQITKDGYNSSPSWSPEGDKIVFERFVSSEIPDIYTMNIDGSNLENITNTATIAERQPDWSPGGKLIVFVSYENKSSEIFTIQIDGSNRTQLTSNSNGDIDPEWSPKGERIAFVRNIMDRGSKIFIMNNDGSNINELTPGTSDERSPTWSPDGSMIAYATLLEGVYHIYVFGVEADDIITTTFTSSNDEAPHWNYH